MGIFQRATVAQFRQKAALFLLTVPLLTFPLPAMAQMTVGHLEQQLQTAVVQKNWSRAIQTVDKLILLVPSQRPQLLQYRVSLEQLARSSSPSPSLQTRPAPQIQGQAAIKRRSGGVPVIDVVFNQRQSFEMLVDSGASITVITRPMAAALGLKDANVVQILTFKTANGTTQMPIVFVNSVTVAGLTTTRVPVAIAGPDMEVGLLGQDFLQRFDVSLRGNRIEFHDRQ